MNKKISSGEAWDILKRAFGFQDEYVRSFRIEGEANGMATITIDRFVSRTDDDKPAECEHPSVESLIRAPITHPAGVGRTAL